jgi:phosphoglycolate phosphatase
VGAAIKVFAVDIDGTLTENGGGMVHLAALAKLRYLEKMGYNVIYVTGRSSIEAYVLAVFGGTTRIAVGENGGVITIAPQEHRLLASKEKCMQGYELLKKSINGVKIKPVFPRMTEVVLLRTFDLKEGQKILDRLSQLEIVRLMYPCTTFVDAALRLTMQRNELRPRLIMW